MKMKMNNGLIYEGPSELNGEPIVAIVNGLVTPSSNRGTGPMFQVYIMPAVESPVESTKSGNDSSVCGDCRMRPLNSNACYVLTWQAPYQVWKAWKGGKVDHNPWPLMSLRWPVRLGAWGDPAALPDKVLERFLPFNTTGYTHQWERYPDRNVLKQTCMASVETVSEASRARELGYRYFRTRLPGEPALDREVDCPKAYGKVQCFSCRLCSGSETIAKSVSIEIHGAPFKVNNYVSLMRGL